MIDPTSFYEALVAENLTFFAGVPDSLLASLCKCIQTRAKTHIIAANEGNAVAMGMGYHLATGNIPVIYMQNSGLGNAVNPLTSLTDPEVYKIPLILIIGWRGEPGITDEPQHIKQGRITESQLSILGIPYQILDGDGCTKTIIQNAVKTAHEKHLPVAILVRKNTFGPFFVNDGVENLHSLTRELAIEEILDLSKPDDIVIVTTGKASREAYEIRNRAGEIQQDFLTVGGMGHTSSIALGISLGQPGKRILCLDGDGSLIMHMGAMPIIGSQKPSNLVHIILNNSAHESVGGQPTVADKINFKQLAQAVGYLEYFSATTSEEICSVWEILDKTCGPILFEIKISTYSRDNLGRPKSTAIENKTAFMLHAQK